MKPRTRSVRSPKRPRYTYEVLADGSRLYFGSDRLAAQSAFDDRSHRNYEGRGDDEEVVEYRVNGQRIRSFGPQSSWPPYFRRSLHGYRRKSSRRDPSHEVAKVELYNLWERGARNPKNGWYVARYVNGRRHQTLKDWKTNEAGARKHAAEWNAGASKRARRDPSAPEPPEPKIIGISHRPEGAQFLVSLHTRKGKKDIVTVIVHDNGARSMTSAVRDVSTPLVASRLVTKYLEADTIGREQMRGGHSRTGQKL